MVLPGLRGGRGANGGPFPDCPEGGPGASGQDSAVSSGAGGAGLGGAPNGTSAAPIQAPVGQVTQIPGAARRLVTSALLRDDESTVLTFRGVPGDQVWLVVSSQPGPRVFPPFLNRPLLLAAPYLLLPLGALDASGRTTLDIPALDLGPGVEAVSYHLQALFWNTTLHERAWSAPSHVLVVDAAF